MGTSIKSVWCWMVHQQVFGNITPTSKRTTLLTIITTHYPFPVPSPLPQPSNALTTSRGGKTPEASSHIHPTPTHWFGVGRALALYYCQPDDWLFIRMLGLLVISETNYHSSGVNTELNLTWKIRNLRHYKPFNPIFNHPNRFRNALNNLTLTTRT